MTPITKTNAGRSPIKTIYVGSALALVLTLAGCGAARKVTTVAGAVTGAASTAISTVTGTAGAAGKTAASLSRGGASAAAGAGGSGGGTVPPVAVAGAAVASGSANTGERTEIDNQAIGAQVSKRIIAGVLFCTNLETVEYRIDCFADQLDQVAGSVPQDADFGDARSILANASDKLAGVAASRASRALRPVTLSSSNVAGTGSTRPVLAVKTAELPAALAEADVILREAETLLLRSSEASFRRKLAYTEMSEAIGSTKVLLRSI